MPTHFDDELPQGLRRHQIKIFDILIIDNLIYNFRLRVYHSDATLRASHTGPAFGRKCIDQNLDVTGCRIPNGVTRTAHRNHLWLDIKQ
jgi:hypothetical protein